MHQTATRTTVSSKQLKTSAVAVLAYMAALISLASGGHHLRVSGHADERKWCRLHVAG